MLDEIIKNKISEVEESKLKVPVRQLENKKEFGRTCFRLDEYITDPFKTGIIAEYKRKSPSRGLLNSYATIEEVTTGYFRSGASALSVLTDYKFFAGTESDFLRARELNPIPLLRKDFIIDEYQVLESKAMGADAILLIASVLDAPAVKKFTRLAHSIGLQVLLELHSEGELTVINDEVDIIGVNNRDLRDFTVDIERSVIMAGKIPEGFLKVSESGISSVFAIKKLRSSGYQGFLMGETFMKTTDPAAAFSEFVNSLTDTA